MSFKSSISFLVSLFSIFILIPVLFIPSFSSDVLNNTEDNVSNSFSFTLSDSGLVWPTPGYTRINSYFGKRSSPTKFASSFHQGIDIGAPAGSNLVAVCDARVTSLGFQGSGGYSIVLKSNNLSFVYHHVDPNYIVSINDVVKAGQIIGRVGPKYVYGVSNNPYKDSSGKPTNGASTRSSLAFYNKKRRQSRQSFRLFLITCLRHLVLHHLHRVNNHDDILNIHVRNHFLLRHSNLVLLHCCILDR